MKAYKLTEVDLPSVIDAWIETKKTIIVLISFGRRVNVKL